MTNVEYLTAILKQQRLTPDEFSALKARRKEIGDFLSSKLNGVSCNIRWAGSYAKDTMIRDSYDADIVVYICSDEQGAGETLEAIYETVETYLRQEYGTIRKTSAIRVMNSSDESYTHVDVVPGRYFDDSESDAWLHRTSGDKVRFKTNLDVHVSRIKESGLRPLIRLMKLWARRNGIVCPTFILELLTVDIGGDVKLKSLEEQVVHILEQFRDNSEKLSVEDPANPHGNDLSEALDDIRFMLQTFATASLQQIVDGNWSAVFGEVEEDATNGDEGKTAALRSVAIHTKPETQPWCNS